MNVIQCSDEESVTMYTNSSCGSFMNKLELCSILMRVCIDIITKDLVFVTRKSIQLSERWCC